MGKKNINPTRSLTSVGLSFLKSQFQLYSLSRAGNLILAGDLSEMFADCGASDGADDGACNEFGEPMDVGRDAKPNIKSVKEG